MSRLLAIDPGILGCGIAQFRDGLLVDAFYTKNTIGKEGTTAQRVGGMGKTIGTCPISGLVTECPQIYSLGKGKGNPNQLIPLAQIGAYVAALHPGAVWIQYLPREWKGNIKKEIMTKRIEQRLSQEERLCIQREGALTHNILDAIGIGLHHLGRLGAKNFYAR